MGALFNNQAEVELRALTAVVAGISPRKHRKVVRPKEPKRRPGWVTPLVLGALREAERPLSVMQIVRAIDEPLDKQAVRFVLQRSKAARSGLIRKVPLGKYAGYELNRDLDAV